MKLFIKSTLFILLLLVISINLFSPAFAENQTPKKILYINSYHDGYKWSDDITNGIKAELANYSGFIDLQIEYMDTQRVTDPLYIGKLKAVYEEKYKNNQFDLILSSDDASFKFLMDYGSAIFPNTPVVFCGVNYFENSMIKDQNLFTGVVEGYDISSTLETALRLHPGTKKVYYINDNTLTGNAVLKEFTSILPNFKNKVEIQRLDGKNLDEIVRKTQNLANDSLILYFVYTKDNEGNYYPYYDAISKISTKSSVPLYGVWDFHLGYGIVGGKLISGFYQGESAAKIAIRVLNGEKIRDIPVITVGTTKYMFDNKKLKQFNISVNDLPSESIIVNLDKPLKKQILLLNSYNKGLQWTDDIEKGIKEALVDKLDNINFSYEYMDVKSNSNPTYLQRMNDFLIAKYTGKKYDVIVVADDQAFNFMTKYHDLIAADTPVVFAGVNYFDDAMIENLKDFTGVVEAYDLKSTIDVALKFQPDTKNFVVINDTTLTGAANRKNLDKITPLYADKVNFDYWDSLNMTDIQARVKSLQKGNIILLMSFNVDKSYNNFTYDESIKLISADSKVPIYGVWDFYLGKGLIGGMLTSGIIQGRTAGEMVLHILDGQKPADIKVVKNATNRYMFDYLQLSKYNISVNDLPPNSDIINKPYSISQFFNENKALVVLALLAIAIIIILSLVIIVMLLKKNLKIRRVSEAKEKIYALTDLMTGIPNRRAGLEHLKAVFEEAQLNSATFTVCFIDIDGLKSINDIYGHQEGDILIKKVCIILMNAVRNNDLLCRLGGDEFLLTLPKTNLNQAKDVWNRIEKEIEDQNSDESSKYKIYLSVGFAEYDNATIKKIDDIIECADNEMYINKAINKGKHHLTSGHIV